MSLYSSLSPSNFPFPLSISFNLEKAECHACSPFICTQKISQPRRAKYFGGINNIQKTEYLGEMLKKRTTMHETGG